MKTFLLKFSLLATITVFVAGCSFTAPKPTPAPVFVTATPVPQFDTPTQEGTLVLGPTPAGTEEAFQFPTLVPATKTPLPSQPPTLTPSFTPSFTDSPAPRSTQVTVRCTSAPSGGFASIFQDRAL